jgi:hypothetical protein
LNLCLQSLIGLTEQKDINELVKVIELSTESAIDLEKSKKWIKTTTETPIN